MSTTPQWQTVLDMLTAAGNQGVHTFTLRQNYIGNPSERIRELESRGYVIAKKVERPAPDRAVGKRYTLVSAPRVERASVPNEKHSRGGLVDAGSLSPDGALFDGGAFRRVAGSYGDLAA